VSPADYHCSYLLGKWEAANDENILRARIESLAAVLIVTVAVDALVGQALFAC
jgi:hypothetical protein